MQQTVIQAWLESQCGQISGATGGVVMLLPRSGGSALSSAASWPRGGGAGQELEAAAKAAYERQQPLSQGRLNGAERPRPGRPDDLLSDPGEGQAPSVLWPCCSARR